MNTLYIDRKHATLGISNGSLVIRDEQGTAQRYPLGVLEQICIMQPVTLDSTTITALADRGIGLGIISGRRETRMAMLTSPAGNEARRRLRQYAARLRPCHHESLVRQLLRAKLAGQYRLLLRMQCRRPDQRRVITHSLQQVRNAWQAVNEQTGIDALRGHEGAASQAVFSSLAAVLPPALGFSGRKRRPPPDPVNALLSLAYTLLFGMAVRECTASGLDPAIGYLHDPSHDRQSLALDLIEPLRPQAEYRLWRLLAEGRLRGSHFSQRQGACLLGKAGRQIFYAEWAQWSGAFAHQLRQYCMRLVHYLNGIGN